MGIRHRGPFSALAANIPSMHTTAATAAAAAAVAEAARLESDFSKRSTDSGSNDSSGDGGWAKGLTERLASRVQLGSPTPPPSPAAAVVSTNFNGAGRWAVLSGSSELSNDVVVVMREGCQSGQDGGRSPTISVEPF
jgi:hypothetical protein